ncbi:MAG: polyphosphate kinase 2 family protein [Bryobacteraceae bacterium]
MSKIKGRLANRFVLKPGKRVKLSKYDPDDTAGLKSQRECEAELQTNIKELFNQQMVLAACNKYAVLVVLQGMDAGGKDGTIRHVMTGLNPQSCRVTSFKPPTEEELHHDFLWRVHRAVPRRGEIGIFNRSHYEDVLVARVHHLVPKAVWSARYEQINDFEKILAKNHVVILKFFLYISKEEQARRLMERIEDPRKNWKIALSDITDRGYWDDYVAAYEDALERCSTERAPWYVIPANKKWFRNLAVSEILVDTISALKLQYPAPPSDVSQLKASLRDVR